MKMYAKYVGITLAAALGIFLFYLSAVSWGRLVSAKDSVMFCLEKPIGIRDAKDADEQIQDEWRKDEQEEDEARAMPEYCIWGQKEGVILTNNSLSRSVLADAVLFCGNPELLFGGYRLPGRKDSQGCLVDEELAWELFGGLEVVGEEVSYEGESYTIRKVIAGKDRVFAFQVGGQPEEDKIMNRITMQRPEGKSLRDLELIWDSQEGMSVTVLDLELLRGISGLCVLLLPVTSCIYFLWRLFGQYREQKKPVWKMAVAALAMLSSVSFFILLKKRVDIPDDYIPTRWSDFSFWADLWNRKREAVKLLMQMVKTDLDYGWMEDFMEALGFGLLAETIALLLFFRQSGAKACIKIKHRINPGAK